MAILRPDGERLCALCPLGKGRDQRRRRTNQKIGLGGDRSGPRQHGLKLAQGGLEAVHFPVAGDQRPDGIGHDKIPSPFE